MSLPWVENVHLLTDQVTGRTFACTANAIGVPWEWRAAVVPAANAHGGIDARAGSPNYLAPRAIATTLIHVYQPGESFKTVMSALELVLVPGNPLTLQSEEEDGQVWLWENVRCTKFDKKMSLDFPHHCEMPLTLIAPDPMQRALYKSDLFFLDNGLFLDDGWFLDDDPDSFLLTGTTTTHVLTNAIAGLPGGADDAPRVVLTGAIGGPTQMIYQDDGGNVLSWVYRGNIQAGETVTVDAEQTDVTSTAAGVDAYGLFALGAHQEFWGRIAPGVNTITIQCGSIAGTPSCHVIWSNRK